MKRFAGIIVLIFFTGYSFGQKKDISESKVPENIKKDLLLKYPQAKGRTWKVKEGEYEVDFYNSSVKHEVKYRSDGTWKKTTWDINKKNVPDQVMDGFKKSDYREWNIDDTEFVKNNSSNELYLITVNKGRVKAELLFNNIGELLKVEEKQ